MDLYKLESLGLNLEKKNYNSIWFKLDKGILQKSKKTGKGKNFLNIRTNISKESNTPISINFDFYNQNGGNLTKVNHKSKIVNYSESDVIKSNYKLNFGKLNYFGLLASNNLLPKNTYNIDNIKKSNFVPISNFSLKGGFIYHVFEGGSDDVTSNEVTSVNNGTYPGKSKLDGAGSGVFASKDFSQGDIVEIVPVLAIPIKDTTDNILKDYVFMLDGENYGMALGYGGMYNHQNNPSVSYGYSDDKKFMIYKANHDIKKGHEMFISYGLGWWLHRNITPVDIEQ